MDDVIREHIDVLDCCEQWFAYNAAGVNTIGKLKNLALEFKTKLTTLDDTEGALVLSLTDLMQLKRTAGRRSGPGFVEISIPRRGSPKEKGANALK